MQQNEKFLLQDLRKEKDRPWRSPIVACIENVSEIHIVLAWDLHYKGGETRRKGVKKMTAHVETQETQQDVTQETQVEENQQDTITLTKDELKKMVADHVKATLTVDYLCNQLAHIGIDQKLVETVRFQAERKQREEIKKKAFQGASIIFPDDIYDDLMSVLRTEKGIRFAGELILVRDEDGHETFGAEIVPVDKQPASTSVKTNDVHVTLLDLYNRVAPIVGWKPKGSTTSITYYAKTLILEKAPTHIKEIVGSTAEDRIRALEAWLKELGYPVEG